MTFWYAHKHIKLIACWRISPQSSDEYNDSREKLQESRITGNKRLLTPGAPFSDMV